MKRILFVLGTRPEAIKILPILWQLKNINISYELLNTNQHKEILDSFLYEEKVNVDYCLNIDNSYSTMLEKKIDMLNQMNNILDKSRYSCIIIQGDTLSALVGAEYGFLNNIPVYHIEAGMRTYDIFNPYPEESFRRMISAMSTKHFTPSLDEYNNLIREGINKDYIYNVGNTIVDYHKIKNHGKPKEKKQILVTIHRRENLIHLDNIFSQILMLAKLYKEYNWIFPVHPNPILAKYVSKYLNNIDNFTIREPLSVNDFYKELLSSKIIISDSGGVHEECILNSKKLLVVRKCTERKVDHDYIEQVNPEESFIEKFNLLLSRQSMGNDKNYYGDGNAAKKIVDIILMEV